MTSFPPYHRADDDTALDDALRGLLRATPPHYDADAHFERVLLRLPGRPLVSNHAQHRTLGPRGRGWWDTLLGFGLGAATAAALAWVLLPAVNLEPAGTVEPLGHPAPADQALVRVRVRDDLPMGVWQQTLQSLHADVVGGPGALGLWTLRIPAEHRDRALQHLSTHPAVLQVVP